MSLQQALRAEYKAAWLQRKNELAAAEQEYLRLSQEKVKRQSPGRITQYRVRKWQVNQAAGRYICSHEAVQHISIRYRLNDFMQAQHWRRHWHRADGLQ